MTTDAAPRWLVRYLKTLGLLVVIAGIGYSIYRELTYGDRVEQQLHSLDCAYARQTSTGAALLICTR